MNINDIKALAVGTAVRVSYVWDGDEYVDFGFITNDKPRLDDSEFSKKFRDTFTGVHFTDQDGDVQRIKTTDNVELCSGCECGNPFTLCHPEA